MHPVLPHGQAERGAGCCRPPVDPQPPFFPRLHLPEFFTLAIGPTSHLARRLGVDSALAQLLGKDLSPAAQIRLARIEPLAVLGLGLHRQVDMRMRLMVVQNHHVAVIGELDLRELPGREEHRLGISASGHGQHDVERLATLADIWNVGTAQPPLALDVVQGHLASLTAPRSSSISSLPFLVM